jgi:hypothetical protein
MSKIDLQLNFDAIRERIEHQKKPYKPGVWADMVGVARNIVSNVHGKVKQTPSLEYIVAVSKATGKSVDYYLWGKQSEEKKYPPADIKRIVVEHQDLVKLFKNPKKAKAANEKLLKLEDIDPDGYDEILKIMEMKIERKESSHKKKKQTARTQTNQSDESSTKRRSNEG